MNTWLIAAMLLVANPPRSYIGVSVLSGFAKNSGSELLVYFPNANDVMLLRQNGPVELHLSTRLSEAKGCCAHRATPALSHRGERIAYVHALTVQPRREAIAVYDVDSGKSMDVFEAVVIWSVSWSPDDSRLAAVADQAGSDARGLYLIVPGRSPERVPVDLDIKGVDHQVSNYSTPSWEPGGKRLALELRRRGLGAGNSAASVIGVLDLETKAVTELVEGVEPSWSPTGDEVAYYARDRKHGFAIATGTGKKRRLFSVGQEGAGAGRGPLFYPPVWSPDGSALLFHQWVDPDLITNVYKLDITTGKSRNMGRTEVQVVGWNRPRAKASGDQKVP